jgi:hypothetical protein
MKGAISILLVFVFLLTGGGVYNIIHEVYPNPPIIGALGALVVWIVGWHVVSRRAK